MLDDPEEQAIDESRTHVVPCVSVDASVRSYKRVSLGAEVSAVTVFMPRVK